MVKDNKTGSSSKIVIYCTTVEDQHLAEATGYGIEEEGLPYEIRNGPISQEEVCNTCHRDGIGVAVHIQGGIVSVFCRQLKEQKPLFLWEEPDLEFARMIGKNAARIIKKKPFVDIEKKEVESDV
jgi:hypothetical protein